MFNSNIHSRQPTEFQEEQSSHRSKIKHTIDDVPLELGQNKRYLQPAIDLPKRHYSMEPDMMNGWKPKKPGKANKQKRINVFSIHYDQEVVDQIVRELYRNRVKYTQTLVYLGKAGIIQDQEGIIHFCCMRGDHMKIPTYLQICHSRAGMPSHPIIQGCFLKFNSDFQGGNLDAVIHRSSSQFDLFMRVDTNTRGHTNWFFFEVCNQSFIGTVTFNICNFKRSSSLYQRGLKPYVCSKTQQFEWHQGGKNVSYERRRLKYQFLYETQSKEHPRPILNTFFTMSFSYDFTVANDTIQFAYCIPYPYTQLNKFISTLQNTTVLPSLKSLSGLSIHVLKITNQDEDEENKKTVLVTGRIHPGQSNASFMAEGFLQFLCSNDLIAKQLRRRYVFYVIPMLNPDGVVAGNYRTSLFGKDLNRTYDQSRKYAFPQTYYLLQFARQLKKIHKKRFCLFIDLHGHSVKKNVFMYGPDFSIQHLNYEISRQLPKLLGNLTTYFRYYSCIFKISEEKVSTARAVFNRQLEIPFTYTVQASNGFYFDSNNHLQMSFTATKWKQMGMYLCKGLYQLKMQKIQKLQRIFTQKLTRSHVILENEEHQIKSDDQISEGDSDSEPISEDLPEEQLREIQNSVRGQLEIKERDDSLRPESMTKKLKQIKPKTTKAYKDQDIFAKPNFKHKKIQRQTIFLPPVNALNRAQVFQTRHNRKALARPQRLRNVESQMSYAIDLKNKPRVVISQMLQQQQRQLLQPVTFTKKQVNSLSMMFQKLRKNK